MDKLPTILWAACFVLLWPSCNSDDVEPVRIMPYEIRWEINAGLNSFETHFFEFYNIATNRTQHFAENELSIDEVDVIQGRQAQLILLDPSLTFEDVRSVEVYLAKGSDPDEDYEVFYTLDLENPNQRRQSIRLIPTLSNIKPIFFEDQMDVIVRINFWRTSTNNLPVRLEWEMEALNQ